MSVSETTTTGASRSTDAAVNKAAKAAGVSAAAVSDVLPTVVETVDVVATVPAKIVLNQKLVVAASVVAGAALGAGALWGLNKYKARKAAKNLNDEFAVVTEESAK